RARAFSAADCCAARAGGIGRACSGALSERLPPPGSLRGAMCGPPSAAANAFPRCWGKVLDLNRRPRRGRRSAGATRTQYAGEVTQLQPIRKGLDDRSRTFQLDTARSHRISPDEVSGPNAGERTDVRVDNHVDREAWILQAHVHP